MGLSGLVDDVNKFIHDVPELEQNDITKARSYYRRSLEILANISSPDKRWKDILQLARLPDPQYGDVTRLKERL